MFLHTIFGNYSEFLGAIFRNYSVINNKKESLESISLLWLSTPNSLSLTYIYHFTFTLQCS